MSKIGKSIGTESTLVFLKTMVGCWGKWGVTANWHQVSFWGEEMF